MPYILFETSGGNFNVRLPDLDFVSSYLRDKAKRNKYGLIPMRQENQQYWLDMDIEGTGFGYRFGVDVKDDKTLEITDGTIPLPPEVRAKLTKSFDPQKDFFGAF